MLAAAEMSPLFLCPMTSGGMDIENITPALSSKRAGEAKARREGELGTNVDRVPARG